MYCGYNRYRYIERGYECCRSYNPGYARYRSGCSGSCCRSYYRAFCRRGIC